MPNFRAPTPEQVEATLLKIPTFQLRRVFYEGLENPLWVRPLLVAGAFKNPPAAEPTGDGYIRDTYWPEISYLTRIAAQVPGDVVDVLVQLRDSNNAWVRWAVFEIGSQIPATESVRLKPLLKAWQHTGFGWRTDPRSLVSFAVSLLEGGQTKVGRSLVNSLFEPRLKCEPGGLQKPELGLDDYWFEKELPRIIPALGENALKAVIGWLEGYVTLSGHASGQRDFSAMDRPSIDSRRDSHSRPEDALVDAVRDAAIPVARINPDDAVNLLLRSGVKLLRKIAIYVVAEAMRLELSLGNNAHQLINAAKQLLGDAASDDEYLRVEYAQLARVTAQADYSAVSVFIPFLEQAYAADLAWMRERQAPSGATPEQADSDIRARADRYRHSWLSAIGHEALPRELQAELARLNAANGVLDNPLEPMGRVTSWTGPNFHTSQEEMAAMAPAELVVHLASWHDKGDGWGPEPSHEGQGRALSGLLTTNPLALRGVLGLDRQLRPTYIRAILQGWEAALKADQELDWPQVAALVEEVLNHSLESPFPIEGDNFDDDPNYRGAKVAAVGLLEELIKKRDAVVVPELFEERFAHLLIFDADDKAAWLEYDSYRPEGSGWDPLNMSLNWQWPIRVRALIFLATRSEEVAWRSEALDALEKEAARPDRHGAGRAALGEGFGRLLGNVPEWLDAHLDELVGSRRHISVEQQILLTTAMATHRYHRALYDQLSPSMLAAIEIGEALVAGWQGESEPLPRIGEWAIDAMILGDKTLDDPVFQAFFTSTTPKIRGGALGKVAWSFFHAMGADASIRDRFGKLWDDRISHVQAHPEDGEELEGIYWLAKSESFSADWWLPRLRDALQLEPGIATEPYMIGKELAHASTTDPANALAVLKLLLNGRAKVGRASFDLSRNAIPLVIANAIRSGDDRLKRDAETYMNELGAQGILSLESGVLAVLDGKGGMDYVDV